MELRCDNWEKKMKRNFYMVTERKIIIIIIIIFFFDTARANDIKKSGSQLSRYPTLIWQMLINILLKKGKKYKKKTGGHKPNQFIHKMEVYPNGKY